MVEEDHAGGGDGGLQLEEGVESSLELRIPQLVRCHLHTERMSTISK